MAIGLAELLLVVPVAGFLVWRRLQLGQTRWKAAPTLLFAAALILPPMPWRLPIRVAAISVAVLWFWAEAKFHRTRRF